MIISKTPLRLGFVGGGTDIEAYYKTGYGAVVSAAINKYIYVTLHKRFDDTIRVSYTQTEIVDRVEDLRHNIIRACLDMVGIKSGIEITTIGEVPGSTGLGSSSSVTVGLLNALYAYRGISLSGYDLIKKACEIEIDILKSPIGKQDQCAAALGSINYLRFNSDGGIENERIWLSEYDIKKLESKLMLFYTGLTREANTILAEQRDKTPENNDTLDYMRDQADTMRTLLKTEGFTERFGELLHEGWMKKRSITNNISSSTIDSLYDITREAGAIGGKLVGAGGGGFLLLYCDEDKQDALRKALGLKELVFRVTRYGSRIVYFE